MEKMKKAIIVGYLEAVLINLIRCKGISRYKC